MGVSEFVLATLVAGVDDGAGVGVVAGDATEDGTIFGDVVLEVETVAAKDSTGSSAVMSAGIACSTGGVGTLCSIVLMVCSILKGW